MQLLAKLKKTMYMEFRVTLNFRKYLKLKLRVFLAGYSVAMVTYCGENDNVLTNEVF